MRTELMISPAVLALLTMLSLLSARTSALKKKTVGANSWCGLGSQRNFDVSSWCSSESLNRSLDPLCARVLSQCDVRRENLKHCK
jgi:hypothetical protein